MKPTAGKKIIIDDPFNYLSKLANPWRSKGMAGSTSSPLAENKLHPKLRFSPPGLLMLLKELITGRKADGPPRSRLGGREGTPHPPVESVIKTRPHKFWYLIECL